MTFFCNKCGYSGEVGPVHRRGDMDAPCNYHAVQLPELTQEERERIRKEFGLDDSQEGKK